MNNKKGSDGWFRLIDAVILSNLKPEDKTTLVELISRADERGECYPSVARLCQARGMKHEKNFKGVASYLPEGLVEVDRRGRQNHYRLNFKAILALAPADVVLKNTPSRADNTPAVADDTPSTADECPF